MSYDYRHNWQWSARSPRDPRRHEDLVTAIAILRKRYGPHIIRFGGALSPVAGEDWPALSTGSLGLDLLTQGLPRGAVTEYAGVDGSGKETLALTALARAQTRGNLCLLLDAGGSVDPDALDAAGVDLEALVIATPSTAGQAWQCLEALCRCGSLDLALALSLSAVLSLPAARPATACPLRRLTLALRGRRTALLLTNHPVPGAGWQTVAETVVAQVARLRIALLPTGPRLGPHGDVEALGALAQVVKHHGVPCGAALPLTIGPAGPLRPAELLDLAHEAGIITERAGLLCAWDTPLGRGVHGARRALAADPALAEQVEQALRAHLGARP